MRFGEILTLTVPLLIYAAAMLVLARLTLKRMRFDQHLLASRYLTLDAIQASSRGDKSECMAFCQMALKELDEAGRHV